MFTDISYILTGYVSGTSSGPSACFPPAGRASQVSSCSVRQILPAAACRETAHDRDRLWCEAEVGRGPLQRGCLAAGLPPAGARARAGLLPCRPCLQPACGMWQVTDPAVRRVLRPGAVPSRLHFHRPPGARREPVPRISNVSDSGASTGGAGARAISGPASNML